MALRSAIGPVNGVALNKALNQQLDAALVADYDVERRPRWTLARGAEEFSRCSLPIRELVA
jgi:hypothetical protein